MPALIRTTLFHERFCLLPKVVRRVGASERLIHAGKMATPAPEGSVVTVAWREGGRVREKAVALVALELD
jgi:hypothetical protein